MKLYYNVYMPDINESIEGRVEVRKSDSINFVISDEFHKEITDQGIYLTNHINDYMKKRFNLPSSYYAEGHFPWISGYIEIRKQFPAISKQLVSNFDELHLYIDYLIQQKSCFYEESWTDEDWKEIPDGYERLIKHHSELITEEDI